jgi:hypothetical protein
VEFRDQTLATDPRYQPPQVITEFCVYAGVPRDLRQGLIRLAKGNGNILGFLS